MNKQQATFDDFFSECYLKYKEYIKNYIAIRICHPHEAEDLAQDVFVRLWEHRAFVNKDTVWSLLFTIARNIVTDKIRRYYKQEDFVAYIYNRMEDIGRNTTEDAVHYRELKRCTTKLWKLFLSNAARSMNLVSIMNCLVLPLQESCPYLPVQ